MKKVFSNMIFIAILFALMGSNYVMASSGSSSVTVGIGSSYTTGVSGVSRSKSYDYINVKANSVYPTGTYDTDNYTKCKTAIYKNSSQSTRISNEYILTEGNDYTGVKINNGYLHLSTVNICFAGNNPSLSAVVDFSYDGK